MSRFTEALNGQVANEFGASQQYVAIAVWYDAETLPQLAAFFYRQAVEERNHAMMLVQYLLDAGEDAVIPGVEAPRTTFTSPAEPVALALAQERRVTEQIEGLVRIARESPTISSTTLAARSLGGGLGLPSAAITSVKAYSSSTTGSINSTKRW